MASKFILIYLVMTMSVFTGCSMSNKVDNNTLPQSKQVSDYTLSSFRMVDEQKYEFLKVLNELNIVTQKSRIKVGISLDEYIRVRVTKLVRADLKKEDKELISQIQLFPVFEKEKMIIKPSLAIPAKNWTDKITFNLHVWLPISWAKNNRKNDLSKLPIAKISTVSGNIVLNNLCCSLDINTISGDVSLEGLQGEATVSTSESDIKASRCIWNRAQLNSSAGQIMVALEWLGKGDYICMNSSIGDLKVILPQNANCFLTANTTVGKVYNNLQLVSKKIKASQRSLEGVLGQGQGLLKLESSTGNIQTDHL